jgi:hypothetical protein
MRQRCRNTSRASSLRLPRHPIISDVSHRDTLDRVVHLIELIGELDLSEGLTPDAHAGLYWMHRILADAIKHVSDNLKDNRA